MAITTFTNNDRIVQESGMENNDNLNGDVYVKPLREQAYGEIMAAVQAIYDTSDWDLSDSNFQESSAFLYLKRIEELLASAYLLMKENGANDVDGDPVAKIKHDLAMDKLNALTDPENPRRLFDENGAEMTRQGAST